jgi:hypothetical protein
VTAAHSTDPLDIAAAQRTFAANKRRVEAGDTFRSQKPNLWRPGKSTSAYGSRRSTPRRPR